MRRAAALLLGLLALLLAACGAMRTEKKTGQETKEIGVQKTGSMKLHYAEHFSVDFYDGGPAKLTVGKESEYLLLPDGAPVPPGLEEIQRIKIPVEQVYLASSSAADLFLQAGAIETVRFTGTAENNWQIPEMREALAEERILYAGKYSTPDYELLLSEGCELAVENTMILHSPATKEMLQSLGIPVLVEYSSYEPHPLGRVEWIRLYGLLTGRTEEADRFFARQEELFRSVENRWTGSKSVAFFYLSPNGGVVVRRQEDYVTKMIEFAGGHSALTDLPEQENALSTVTIQMESFYEQARDADVLIYNSTTAGDVENMQQFLGLSPLLQDFRAVHEGNVWCTEMSMFQRSSAAAGIIAELRAVLQEETEGKPLQYLHRID